MTNRIIIPNTYPHHQKLTDMINSFASKNIINRIYISYSKTAKKHFIIMHIANNRVPEKTSLKWIKKAIEQFNTYVIILGDMDIERHIRLGSLFINQHCNTSTFIYKAEGHEFNYPKAEKQLKEFKQFKEEYFRIHDILCTQIRKAESLNSITMAYHLNSSIFEHHLYYLEFLCIGEVFNNDTLQERFLRLEKLIPEIKSVLVKKTETSYFLTDAFNSAKKADKEQEIMCVNDEFEDAIAETEQLLYHLVVRLFRETKNEVKKQIQNIPAENIKEYKTTSPYEPVTKILIKYFRIEEIFLIHQEEISSINQKTTILYILLISNRIGNQDLFNMIQIVSQQTDGKFKIVPIAHSTTWIQEYLWEYQSFFQKIMIPEKSIYTANLPTTIHWHKDISCYDTDDGIYYRRCSDLFKVYKILRSQEDSINYEGFGIILSSFFYRACIIFTYVTLRYRPNEINIRILWQLCEYGDSNIKNLYYLIQKLPFDFFEFLNPSKNLYKNAFILDENSLSILDELAQGFIDLLDKKFV